jgi:hypothetical protein
MQAVTSQDHSFQKPILEESYQKVYTIVKEVEQQFIEKHGRQLDLTNSEDFIRLGELFDFRAHMQSLVATENKPSYKGYDLAQVFIKEFIKCNLKSSLDSDHKVDFVEAIFSKLFYNVPSREKAANIKTLLDLAVVYHEHSLDLCLKKVQELAYQIIAARDEAANLNSNFYSNSFSDYFHNTLVYAPPFFNLDKKRETIAEVLECLRWEVSYIPDRYAFYA